MAPSVYLDECVHAHLARALRRREFTAVSALEEQMLTFDDESQLAYATARGAMLLTHDYRDFFRLHHVFQSSGKGHAGIIILPRRSELDLQELRTAMMLDWLGTLGDVHGRFFRWGSLQNALIGGYRPPGYSEEDVRFVLGQSPMPPRSF